VTPEQAELRRKEIEKEYGPRIVELLGSMADAIHEGLGLDVGSPVETHDENPCWTLMVEALPWDIDIRFQIVWSEEWGEDNELAFAVDVSDEEGHVLGGLTPGNYTNKLGVPLEDKDAIEERFNLFVQAENESMLRVLRMRPVK
jgi:hypothetical protein